MWLLRTLKLAAILTPFMPIRLGYIICTVLGAIYFVFNARARRNILRNLQNVAPGMRLLRREITAARVCITVITNYYDLIRLRSVDRESVLDLVDVSGLEHLERALVRGRGAIILSGHVGNFSVMARLPAAYGYPAAVIAEEVQPRELFNYMTRLRSAMGIEVIPPRSRSIRQVLELLCRNGLLLVAGDRDVTDRGVPVTFFGEETTLPAGPVILAMRSGAALIPACTHRNEQNRSNVEIWPEIELDCSGDWESDLNANLRKTTAYLEHIIERDPGQWAVLQSVWPPTTDFGRSEGLGSADEYLPRAGREVDSEVDEYSRKAG